MWIVSKKSLLLTFLSFCKSMTLVTHCPSNIFLTIKEIFVDYIPVFMQVFLDDFVVYTRRIDHFEHL